MRMNVKEILAMVDDPFFVDALKRGCFKASFAERDVFNEIAWERYKKDLSDAEALKIAGNDDALAIAKSRFTTHERFVKKTCGAAEASAVRAELAKAAEDAKTKAHVDAEDEAAACLREYRRLVELFAFDWLNTIELEPITGGEQGRKLARLMRLGPGSNRVDSDCADWVFPVIRDVAHTHDCALTDEMIDKAAAAWGDLRVCKDEIFVDVDGDALDALDAYKKGIAGARADAASEQKRRAAEAENKRRLALDEALQKARARLAQA